MMKRRFPAKALSLGSLLLALIPAASLAEHATIPVAPLTTYGKLDPAGVTVSGISSGAFFAHQFHVAYSGLVKGAGMVAGGLYACAEQVDDVLPPHPFTGIPKSVAAALAVCTRFGRTGFDAIHDRFFRDAGYNAFADANHVVVLYPQATSWRRLTDPSGLIANPEGCWDWWGYAGDDAYFTRDGKQMRAVRAMIARMLP